jgi:hypothetical protein
MSGMKKKGRRLKRYLGLRREPVIASRGGIEHLLPGLISGWVVAKDLSLHEVRLLVGPHLIARAEINQARPDVCDSLGWQGTPGFSLVLPAELPPVDWQPAPRLLALSADGSGQVELTLMGKPKQTAVLLRALLQSELLGLEGHFDGLQQGALWGWACRRGQQRSAQIWLQAAGKVPVPVQCHLHRDGLQAINLPSHSGFVVHPAELPQEWAGQEVWLSFDQQGQFRLPQAERVILPAGPGIGAGVVPTIQTNSSLTVGNNQPTQVWLTEVPEDLRHHWQALEHFRLYLDKIEQQLDARDQTPKEAKQSPVLPKWWQRLLGGES